MGMSIEEWDAGIGKRLKLIDHHASECARHVSGLRGRPPFTTLAEDQLERLQTALERALSSVKHARGKYGSKDIVD